MGRCFAKALEAMWQCGKLGSVWRQGHKHSGGGALELAWGQGMGLCEPGWGLGVCLSSTLQGDAAAVGLDPLPTGSGSASHAWDATASVVVLEVKENVRLVLRVGFHFPWSV